VWKNDPDHVTIDGTLQLDHLAHAEVQDSGRITSIVKEARQLDPRLPEPARFVVEDRCRGPGYAVMTTAQRKLVARVTSLSGLVLDPVYSGKAFSGLVDVTKPNGLLAGKRVLFLHTGGLPGLLAQAAEFASVVEDEE